jgi:hypothetical protein
MNTREFLTLVWPIEGPYCIAKPWFTKEKKRVYAHKALETINDVVAFVMQERGTTDLYFAVHTLKVARQTNPSTGKLQTYRTHANMKEARAFFFDLDVGPQEEGKLPKYATQQDAKDDLDRFLFATNLPTPFVVSSGGGLHVYWIVTDPIESEEWKTPADKLHWLAKKHHLRADPSRTTDQSSVLRVPNTFNYKNVNAPRKVEILIEGVVTDTEDFLNEIEALVGTEYVPVQYLQSTHAPRLPGVRFDGRLTPSEEVAEVCEQMRIFRDSQGNVPEPHWHVGVGTMKYTDGGESLVHEWSQGHANYTFAETQDKIDAWTMNPPSCDKIKANCDAAVCERCPNVSFAKNPIAIANKVWEQRNAPAPRLLASAGPQPVTHLIDPPFPWQRTPTGIIEIRKKGENPEDDIKKPKFVKICDYDIFPVFMFESLENEQGFTRWAVTIPRSGQEIIDLPNNVFADHKNVCSALFNKKVNIAPQHYQRMYDFMKAYLRELQKFAVAIEQYDHVGWDFDEHAELKAFILAGKKLSLDDGSLEVCAMSKTTQDVSAFMGQAGSLDKQIELMEFYNHDDFLAQQFVIGASLATPLFRWSTLHGVVINMAGETGQSKSTGLSFAASLWGDPKLYPLSGLKMGGTEKAKFERGAMLRNLPFMIDEITLLEPQVARELVMSVSQPGDYTSMKQDRTLRPPRKGRKSFIMICTANNSLTQLINFDSRAGQAGTARIFEIQMRRSNERTKQEADAVMRLLCKNYGHVGESFMSQILPAIDKAGERYIRELQRVEQAIGATQEERFMTSAAASGIYGVKFGTRLGYFPYDPKRVEEWVIEEQIPAMRGIMSGELSRRDPEIVVGDYLDEINGKTARVELDTKGNVGGVVIVPNGELCAHIDITNQEIWVRLDPFRNYCGRNGHDMNNILGALLKKGMVTNARVRKFLAEGTSAAKTRVYCFIIDLKKCGATFAPPPIQVDQDDTVVAFKPRKKGAT